jgi:hypothetical protein
MPGSYNRQLSQGGEVILPEALREERERYRPDSEPFPLEQEGGNV